MMDAVLTVLDVGVRHWQFTLALVGLLYLFWRGQLRRHRGFLALMLWWLLVAAAGFVFLLARWTGGAQVVLVAGLGLGVSYFAWFARKPSRQPLDWLKLLWVLALAFWIGNGAHRWHAVVSYQHGLLVTSFCIMLLYGLYILHLRALIRHQSERAE